MLGTRFEVRRAQSGEVGVAVARGRVAVRRDAGGPAFDGVLFLEATASRWTPARRAGRA
ncbi:hypothetical protein ACRAWD_13930 [Caulobacter segnis]